MEVMFVQQAYRVIFVAVGGRRAATAAAECRVRE